MHASPATLLASASAIAPIPPAPEERTRSTILVVDDNDFVSGLVTCILEAHGHQVMRARDARDAERLFAEHEPVIALALIDCRLPDGDGLSLARRLRESAASLPVLLMSGQKYAGARAPEGDAWKFLPKPFLPGQLRASVDTLLHAIA
jgi:DNA-binding response OmpR family regulator